MTNESNRLLRYGSAALVIAGFLYVLASIVLATKTERTLWRAASALNAHEFQTAERLAQEALDQDPDSALAAVIAGNAASDQHEHERAIGYYQRVQENAGQLTIRAKLGLGERWLKLGDIEKAEHNFQQVLKAWPDHFLANKQYAYLMQVQGRTWESVAPSMRMIRQGRFGAADLHIVGSPENRFQYDERFLEVAQRRTPNSIRPFLAEAKLAKLKNNTAAARQKYATLLGKEQSLLAPYVELGRIYLDSIELDKYRSLEEKLPEGADLDAGVWTNRALYALSQKQPKVAARCLAEALLLSPNRVEPTYLLSQILVSLGEEEVAQQFAQRAKKLAFIELSIPEFYDDPTPERTYTLLQKFRELGRYWEAAAMAEFALRYFRSTPNWASKELKVTAQQLRKSGAEFFPNKLLISLNQFENYPLPEITLTANQTLIPQQSQASTPQIRFEDRAHEVRLDFTYFNGSLSSRGMEHIFETTGGGTVAVDYDCDLWPDLYLTQGAAIWSGDDPVERTDHFFRNREGVFVDATLPAGLGDANFSQGAATGDFNNDGFADLYVCNLTGNRFYENNGDGTFSEITEQTQTAGDDWSLSSVIVDLNADSLPDLYVVNYLDRAAVFARRCKRNGEPLTCAPTMFPAAQDRVYLNMGNGKFQDVTADSGVVQAEGKGLAILAADLDHSGMLSLFIGNDTTPNFLLSNRTQPKGSLKFEETGLLSGLALDGSGRSQATMGIAFGDVIGSADAELFITNFYGDSNTFYLQESPAQFVEYSRQAKLREPSLQTLGFGTEFLDADLNGELDLFVTNGHVDRTFATGEPDEMAPQFFYNTGNGVFELLEESRTGDYFTKKYLGRTVCRLDWNRDAKDDLCVLHLYSPVALLTNESERTGKFMKFHLRGTTCARDAIGTTIELKTADRVFTHQLVAGDGYMTSNERVLTIGLGETDIVEQVKITWADGTIEVFEHVVVDSEYIAIQGQRKLVTVHR